MKKNFCFTKNKGSIKREQEVSSEKSFHFVTNKDGVTRKHKVKIGTLFSMDAKVLPYYDSLISSTEGIAKMKELFKEHYNKAFSPYWEEFWVCCLTESDDFSFLQVKATNSLRIGNDLYTYEFVNFNKAQPIKLLLAVYNTSLD